MGALTLLWKFRTPIAIILACLAAFGALKWYGYTKYKEGKAEIQAELDLKQAAWNIEAQKWNRQVELQKSMLEMEQKRKNEIVKRNKQEFDVQQKLLKQTEKERDEEIRKNIKPNDTVTVPAVFERLYNDAAEGSRFAVGNSGNFQVPQNRPSIVGETKTFDAVAFTQVVTENLAKYNSLALQCSKLINTVKELEDTYGIDTERPKGKAGTNGGNLPNGTTGPVRSGPSG